MIPLPPRSSGCGSSTAWRGGPDLQHPARAAAGRGGGPARAEAAVADVVARHEALRTLFPEVDGADDVGPATSWTRPRTWSALPLADTAEARARRERWPRPAAPLRPADRAAGARRGCSGSAPGEHVLLLVLHHIAGDGWSMGPLVRGPGRRLRARGWRAGRRTGRRCRCSTRTTRCGSASCWASEDDPDSVVARQLAYWRGALAGLPEELALPADRPRPAVPSHRGGTVAAGRPGRGARARLAGLARRRRRDAVHGAAGRAGGAAVPAGRRGRTSRWARRSPGATDEALDRPGRVLRQHPGAAHRLAGDPAFRELLARVREADLAAYAHQDVPFERAGRGAQPRRAPCPPPAVPGRCSCCRTAARPTPDVARPAAAEAPPSAPGTAQVRPDASRSRAGAADGARPALTGPWSTPPTCSTRDDRRALSRAVSCGVLGSRAGPRTCRSPAPGCRRRPSGHRCCGSLERHRAAAARPRTAGRAVRGAGRRGRRGPRPSVRRAGVCSTYGELGRRVAAHAWPRQLAAAARARPVVAVALARSPELVVALLAVRARPAPRTCRWTRATRPSASPPCSADAAPGVRAHPTRWRRGLGVPAGCRRCCLDDAHGPTAAAPIAASAGLAPAAARPTRPT